MVQGCNLDMLKFNVDLCLVTHVLHVFKNERFLLWHIFTLDHSIILLQEKSKPFTNVAVHVNIIATYSEFVE